MEKSSFTSMCGGGDITGCRFSLSVMCGDYADKILKAVGQVDTRKVWSGTDALSTIYRGERVHVVDAARGFFVYANDRETHMIMEATFSKGCPGDADADYALGCGDTRLNPTDQSFDVLGKISFYPLGVPDYMEHIGHVVAMAREKNLYRATSHYATELHGDVNALFAYFDEILAYAEQRIAHYVLQVTLSVNSPTKTQNRGNLS